MYTDGSTTTSKYLINFGRKAEGDGTLRRISTLCFLAGTYIDTLFADLQGTFHRAFFVSQNSSWDYTATKQFFEIH